MTPNSTDRAISPIMECHRTYNPLMAILGLAAGLSHQHRSASIWVP